MVETLGPLTTAIATKEHTSETTPPHRKVRCKHVLRFNDEIEVRRLPDNQWERYIGDLPWRIKQKQGTIGKDFGSNGTTTKICKCRSYKLKNIDPTMRSLQEQETWNKMLETAATSARVRAVQLHLSTISDFPALPTILRCCDTLQAMAAFVKRQSLSADEADRVWIYDTGAGTCFIGENYLTDKEKRSIFKVAPITMYSAT